MVPIGIDTVGGEIDLETGGANGLVWMTAVSSGKNTGADLVPMGIEIVGVGLGADSITGAKKHTVLQIIRKGGVLCSPKQQQKKKDASNNHLLRSARERV